MTAPHSCSPDTFGLPFQKRVVTWLMACFSMEVCRDGIERNHRFLEEALELVQSLECTRSEAHQLVDYVFDRPVGEPMQELGGALVTLTALANCHDMDLMEAGETELARVWTKIDKIRAKQAAKPKHSPLPEHVTRSSAGSGDALSQEAIEKILYEHLYLGEPGQHEAIKAVAKILSGAGVAQPPIQAVQKTAADAIRTFCQSLGAHAVVVSSDGVERIYHAGISLDALSVAVALALSSTDGNTP